MVEISRREGVLYGMVEISRRGRVKECVLYGMVEISKRVGVLYGMVVKEWVSSVEVK